MIIFYLGLFFRISFDLLIRTSRFVVEKKTSKKQQQKNTK